MSPSNDSGGLVPLAGNCIVDCDPSPEKKFQPIHTALAAVTITASRTHPRSPNDPASKIAIATIPNAIGGASIHPAKNA